jgi:hypothetical protein
LTPLRRIPYRFAAMALKSFLNVELLKLPCGSQSLQVAQ